MKKFLVVLIATLSLGHISALCSNVFEEHEQRRTTDTCGDASAAFTYFTTFSLSQNMHEVNIPARLAAVNAAGNDWQIDAPSFRAWASPGQLSTVPIYELFNSKTTDVFYRLSTDGTPPTASGYQDRGIIGYVYPTQICDSVPLYEAALPSTDHWYTTSLAELNLLLSTGVGWVSGGIVAYVLPIDCGCGS